MHCYGSRFYTTNDYNTVHRDAVQRDLSVVGKISGVYKKTMANAAEIANLPIILNAVLTKTSDTLSPVQDNQTYELY